MRATSSASTPGYSTFAFATADARRQVVISSSLFSPTDGSQVPHLVNAVNPQFCGEPWMPLPAAAPIRQAGPLT